MKPVHDTNSEPDQVNCGLSASACLHVYSLHLSAFEGAMHVQKTQQDTFYLMPSVLIFSTEEKIFSCKSSLHNNTLPRERGFVGGGGGWGEGKEDHYGQKLAYLHL